MSEPNLQPSKDSITSPEAPCSSAIPIVCGELKLNQTNSGQGNNYVTSSYNCLSGAPSNAYSAPDITYIFTLTETKEVNVSLEILNGVDLDFFLFSPNCQVGNCFGGSANNISLESAHTQLTAGTYYIIVDGYNGAVGNFNLQLSCSCSCSPVQSGDLLSCEDFENPNFAVGDSINPESVRWRKWSSGAADAVIASASSNKYLQVTKNGSYEPDVLFDLGFSPTTRFRLSFDILPLAGKAGGYYMMHQLPDATGANSNTAYRVVFNSNGSGVVTVGNPSNSQTINFKCVNGSWNKVMQIIDLNQNRAELWINDNFVGAWTFSTGYTGSGSQDLNVLRAINFDAHDANFSYRVDNICLWTTINPCIITTQFNPVCLKYGNAQYSNAGAAYCDLYTG
ncbi:MAG: hypothetical protein ABIQ93_14310, partial [Saprospiraceae bacterium]